MALNRINIGNNRQVDLRSGVNSSNYVRVQDINDLIDAINGELSGVSSSGPSEELIVDETNPSSGAAFTYTGYADTAAITAAGFTRLLIQTQGLNTASGDIEATSTLIDVEDVLNTTRMHYHETDSAGEIVVRTNAGLTGGTITHSGFITTAIKIYALPPF